MCVLSASGWLRTVTHFKSGEWSSQTGMLDSLQLFFPLASHMEVVSAPPLTPFMSDRERCKPEQSSCSLSAFGLLRALGFKVWDVRGWLEVLKNKDFLIAVRARAITQATSGV